MVERRVVAPAKGGGVAYKDPAKRRAYQKTYNRINKPHRSEASKTKRRQARAIRVAELQAIAYEAKSVPCMDCGVCYPPYVMDFDHRLGEVKKADVARLTRGDFSKQALIDEIAKCDVVCSNCHRERTWGV